MSSNWNVYKLFKSGKRAKAPIHTFSHEGDHKEAITQFEKIEIKNVIDRYGERIKKFDLKDYLTNYHFYPLDYNRH